VLLGAFNPDFSAQAIYWHESNHRIAAACAKVPRFGCLAALLELGPISEHKPKISSALILDCADSRVR
jgi:hypothetical protein